MSIYQIIGIIAGAASIVGMMWGAVWAVCKVMFMFGEYKGKQDALKEYSEENIKKLNTTFIAFSEKLDSMNKKIDTQNTSIIKIETKVDSIEKKLDMQPLLSTITSIASIVSISSIEAIFMLSSS